MVSISSSVRLIFEIGPLQDADAVLGRDRTAEFAGEVIDQFLELVALVGRMLVIDARMQIAVADVAHHDGECPRIDRLDAGIERIGVGLHPVDGDADVKTHPGP